ncbi:MAG TPA: ABC transporter ATP-binding protein [Fimbriiglobus sp.]|nr:ABC transporter ATP-binding protein [Fimbriiglobus sp.]
MRNFYRALKLSGPYRYRLFLSFASALCVAGLWSLNLSAIFPVLKILSTGKNLQSWVDEEIATYQKKVDGKDDGGLRQRHIANLRTAIQKLNEEPPSPFRDTQLREWSRELAFLEGKLEDDTSWLYRYQWLRSHVIRHLPANGFETFAWIVAGLIVCVVVKGVFEFWQEFLVGGVVSRTLFDLRNRFYRAAVHQDIRQVAAVGTPELMARVTNDAEQVGAGMKVLYGKMVVEPLKMFTCLLLALWISWQLTLTFLVLVVPLFVALGRVSRSMKKASRRVLERMSELYKILRETFDGLKVVKAFTMEPAERRRFRAANNEYYRRSMRVVAIDAFASPVVEVLGVSAVALALLAGAYLVLEGQTRIFGMNMTDQKMSFESLVQLYVFLAAIADPVRKLSSVYTKVQGGAAAADRVFALYDRLPEVQPNAGGPVVPKHGKSVEFRNVCFSYVPGQDPGTLNNIDLFVQAGETVALVGPNGCGKTTLLGLLPRFYDPDHGAVFVDGVNLRTANLRSLRKQIGLVTQDTVLFNDTIFANIAYGRHGATREEVEAAARKAFAHEFIVTKPAGYDEQVGDFGSQLSGGQKQRIALARAILRDPRILILDEFTSQIDAESEAKIQQALREFVRGRTTFLITHRLSTLELADRIVVMDTGRVAAVGTHRELLADCPAYQRLYEAHLIAQDDADEPTGAEPPASEEANGKYRAA